VHGTSSQWIIVTRGAASACKCRILWTRVASERVAWKQRAYLQSIKMDVKQCDMHETALRAGIRRLYQVGFELKSTFVSHGTTDSCHWRSRWQEYGRRFKRVEKPK